MTNRIPIFSIYISLQFIPYINFLIYINLNSQQNSLLLLFPGFFIIFM